MRSPRSCSGISTSSRPWSCTPSSWKPDASCLACGIISQIQATSKGKAELHPHAKSKGSVLEVRLIELAASVRWTPWISHVIQMMGTGSRTKEWQDFELWDDVGLNIPKPPDLLHVYRNCGNSLPLNMNTVDVAVSVDPSDLPGDYFTQQPVQQTEQQQEVVQELEYQISLLNTEKQSLAEQIKKLQR
ncbi:hypothetical protein PO909_017035 [Leuciscus waleckii]